MSRTLLKSLSRTLLIAASLAAASLPAQARRLAEVEVMDRATGEVLRQHWHEGRRYVVGQPGHAYEIAVRNRTGERLLAVMSVDGVNVLSGETAGTGQGGYVFSGYERDTVRGWRKSLQDIAQFHFTALPDSYAARTGRPGDVGVIGVAIFREAQQWPRPYERNGEREELPGWYGPKSQDSARGDAAGEAAPAPRAKSAPQRDRAAPEAQTKRGGAPLGTGHGRREYDPVGTTHFERASATPDEVITLYYDSRPNLVAMGVLPTRTEYSRRRPQAFPGGFVPDP